MIADKKIGIVILNYKDALTTVQLCKKIETYVMIDHIVVVDNLSPDDSMKYLEKLENEKIHVLKSDKNGGYSYGNNFGAFYLIEKYQVDVLFIANPDVQFEENFIEKISQIIISNRAQAASGIMINRDGNSGVKTLKINSYFNDLIDNTILIKRLKQSQRIESDSLPLLRKAELLSGSLFAVDASVFKEIGGFDDHVFLYCEERIFGKKFQQNGYKMLMDTSTSFLHMHAVSIGKSLKKIEQLERLNQSRLYYWEEYEHIGNIKKSLLKLAMQYGVAVRKLIYRK